MKKSCFKRTLAVILSAAILVGVMPIAFAQSSEAVDVDYTITNPYAAVDWENWDQYKAALHNHTIATDGSYDFNEMIEIYYARGYDILSITDHGTVDTSWTEPNIVPALQFVLSVVKRENIQLPNS